MWREILDYGRQLFALTETTENNSKDIEDLQQEVKRLAQAMRQISMVMQH